MQCLACVQLCWHRQGKNFKLRFFMTVWGMIIAAAAMAIATGPNPKTQSHE